MAEPRPQPALGIVDLHCHLLPGVDDGAADLEQALAMARRAVAEGICTAVTTPHTWDGRYEVGHESADAAFAALRAAVESEGLPLQLKLAAENRLDRRLLEAANAGRVRTLGDSAWVLVELPPRVMPPRLEQSLFALRTAGLRPVLAHPERYPGFRGKGGLRRLKALADGGTLMQLTGEAFLGSGARRRRVRRLLEAGLCHLVASDAHGIQQRPPCARAVYRALCRFGDEGLAARLMRENPARILADQQPLPVGLERSWWRRVRGLWT